MSSLLAIIGFFVGVAFALNSDAFGFSAIPAYGLIGALLGLLVARLARNQKADAAAMDGGSSLSERVLRLERLVGRLQAEMATRQAGSATTPAGQPGPSLPEHDQRAVPAAATPTPAPLLAEQGVATPRDRSAAAPPPHVLPDPLERGLRAARAWLLGGNTMARVGIVVLFFGVAFLLKYAADNDLLPIELRLTGVAMTAIALLGLGWRLRERRHAYGLALQGGGVGMLYLTIFASTRLYGLLPVGLALPLMIAICVLGAVLAVRQDAATLAFMGSAGGFLAPLLLSSGGGSHIALFGYYALLNAGILAMAWFKAWRPLNLLGFSCTFGIGAVWGASAYQSTLFASTEFFLLLFFLMYVGIAVCYAIRRDLSLTHHVDGTLVFGTPLLAFLLQAGLVRGKPFALAYSALTLAAFYLALATWLRRRHPRLSLLCDAILALALIFLSLAVPLAFTSLATSAVWALEGAGLVWIGVRQRRLPTLILGLLLQAGSAFAFAVDIGATDHDHVAPPMLALNSHYLGILMISLAALFSGWRLHGKAEARDWLGWLPDIGLGLFVWGMLWWSLGGFDEIRRYFDLRGSFHGLAHNDALGICALFGVLTAGLARIARRGLDWLLMRWPALALPPLLALIGFSASLFYAPLSQVVALPVALALSWLLLYRERDDFGPDLLDPSHALSFWTLCVLLSVEGWRRLGDWVPEGAWQWSAWAYGYGLALLLLAGPGARLAWPVQRHRRAYLLWGGGPLAALLWGWSVASVFSDGGAAPLFYLPLFNPLDVAQLLAALAVAVWLRRLRIDNLFFDGVGAGILPAVAGATGFVWLNVALLRTLHHWTDVPYTLHALGASTLVQASVSVFWTACALTIMVVSTRRGNRVPWLIGAGLLGITVIKLFLFDLSFLSGISRIVAFIGVGLLLLLTGYVSPLPPRKLETSASAP
ncbi:DUF2339 domain-containing protein [Achromobacter xylosoxidans]|uniref:DUF2339 domain-containing protein n=1 Tax=Alcaligenes xylosoxydans xylosoxydans TaxID=85698 RepID=UPI000970D851|nr:DUF2339 domain-containing protein [Achromobacter xylosoxidans]BEG74090.1 hypothetical protein HBIAX_01137 [Achromobacter xylosoxidans]